MRAGRGSLQVYLRAKALQADLGVVYDEPTHRQRADTMAPVSSRLRRARSAGLEDRPRLPGGSPRTVSSNRRRVATAQDQWCRLMAFVMRVPDTLDGELRGTPSNATGRSSAAIPRLGEQSPPSIVF